MKKLIANLENKMLYVIIAEDIQQSSDLRAKYSDQHRARISALVDQGRLVVAGPCPKVDGVEFSDAGVSGSVIIAEFDSEDDAKRWLSEDPFVIHGVYQSVNLKPFKKVFP
jgi:hypothetical protein